jgi:hypothetical protein
MNQGIAGDDTEIAALMLILDVSRGPNIMKRDICNILSLSNSR